MSYKENQIKHENGNFWVLEERKTFTVFRNGFTHATSDSAYDDLSLAVARCNYLAKREHAKNCLLCGKPGVKK